MCGLPFVHRETECDYFGESMLNNAESHTPFSHHIQQTSGVKDVHAGFNIKRASPNFKYHCSTQSGVSSPVRSTTSSSEYCVPKVAAIRNNRPSISEKYDEYCSVEKVQGYAFPRTTNSINSTLNGYMPQTW